MRKLGILLFLAVSVSIGFAQQDGGASTVLRSIYIPPLRGAPFSAIVHTEWAKPLAGGGSTTTVNQRRVVRDRDGRVYQERWLLVPKQGKIPSRMNMIQIYDPNQHSGLDCFALGPRKGECALSIYEMVESPDAPVTTGPLPDNTGFRTHEELGTQVIEGIETVGTRDTTIINAGAMGNDEPMKIVREFWHSQKLGVNLVSIVSDPRFGTQTFTLTDVDVSEPDPRYFELPAGFHMASESKPGEAAN